VGAVGVQAKIDLPTTLEELMRFLDKLAVVKHVDSVPLEQQERLREATTEVHRRLDGLLQEAQSFAAVDASEEGVVVVKEEAYFERVEACCQQPSPPGIKPQAWLLAQASTLLLLAGKVFMSVSTYCTRKSCPEMDITEDFFYKWRTPGHGKDSKKARQGIAISAGEYIRLFFDWAKQEWFSARLDSDAKYPRSFSEEVLSKVLRIYGHISFKHIAEPHGEDVPKKQVGGSGPPNHPKRAISMAFKDGVNFDSEDDFSKALKKLSAPNTKKKRGLFHNQVPTNIPSVLSDMTTFLLLPEVRLPPELKQHQRSSMSKSATRLLKKAQKGNVHLQDFDPLVVLFAIGYFLLNTKDPLFPPEYIDCLSAAMTLPTAEFRMICVKRTLYLIKGEPKELLHYVFHFLYQLICDKGADEYELSAVFGPVIVRAPAKNPYFGVGGGAMEVPESLSSAITSLILSEYEFFFEESPTTKPTSGKEEGTRPSGPAKEESMGTFVVKDLGKPNAGAEPEPQEEAYGTFVIRDVSSDKDMQVAEEIIENVIICDEEDDAKDDSAPQYREPDKWEKNLVSLTRGEWGEDMDPAAFHRYKKSRRKLYELSWGEKQEQRKSMRQLQSLLGGEETNAMQEFARKYKRASVMVPREKLSHELDLSTVE